MGDLFRHFYSMIDTCELPGHSVVVVDRAHKATLASHGGGFDLCWRGETLVVACGNSLAFVSGCYRPPDPVLLG